ncbi:MAG: hypothetical protein ACM31M_00820 [Nitrososphaerota archaeon]
MSIWYFIRQASESFTVTYTIDAVARYQINDLYQVQAGYYFRRPIRNSDSLLI